MWNGPVKGGPNAPVVGMRRGGAGHGRNAGGKGCRPGFCSQLPGAVFLLTVTDILLCDSLIFSVNARERTRASTHLRQQRFRQDLETPRLSLCLTHFRYTQTQCPNMTSEICRFCQASKIAEEPNDLEVEALASTSSHYGNKTSPCLCQSTYQRPYPRRRKNHLPSTCDPWYQTYVGRKSYKKPDSIKSPD